jgi:hypothetical protein
MSATFDPDAGVLRLSHAALSVLARLASEPNHPELIDHAIARPLAALRGAGILGPSGIHPDVRPLARAIGSPVARLTLDLAEPGTVWEASGWTDDTLLVLAVPARDTPDAFDLMADVVGAGADLISDLVALPPVTEAADLHLRAHAETLRRLLEDPDAPPHPDVPGPLLRLVRQLHARWRLTVSRTGDDATDTVELLDCGDQGLWRISTPDPTGSVDLTPTTAVEVRRRLAEAVRSGQP